MEIVNFVPTDKVAYIRAYNAYLHTASRLLVAMLQGQSDAHIDAHRTKAREAHDALIKQARVGDGDGFVIPEFRRNGKFVVATPAILMPHSAQTYGEHNCPTIDTVQFVKVAPPELPLIYGDLISLN